MKPEIGNIDDVIHGRLRLGVMVYLANAPEATFNELKDRLEATQGNLSVQLRKLEEAGYVTVTRKIEGRKTVTRARLTDDGRGALKTYVETMSGLLGQL